MLVYSSRSDVKKIWWKFWLDWYYWVSKSLWDKNHKCFRKTESYQIFKPKHEIVCIISLWVNIFFVYRKPTLRFWNNFFWDSFGFHSVDSYISHVCPWYAPRSEIYLTWICWWFLPYLLTCRCDKYWWKTQWNYCDRFVDNKINIDFGNNNTNW